MELEDHVDGLLHEPTQIHDRGIDLTVSQIYEVDRPGRIDFGGGELESAELTEHDRVWRNEDDDYQWWNLDAGTYVYEYNEEFSAPEPITVQPRPTLLERGATHPTMRVQETFRGTLTIGGRGLRLKENARISTVLRP